MKNGTKIMIGCIVVLAITAAFFIYLYVSTDTKTVTYNPADNPYVQELIKQHDLEVAVLMERSRQDSIRMDAQKNFALDILKSVAISDAKINNYYQQIRNFNQMIENITDDAQLQKIANETYRKAHKK